MGYRARTISIIRNLLAERNFNERQVESLIPKLDENFILQPRYLAEIIDTWNSLMANCFSPRIQLEQGFIPAPATPPKDSFLQSLKVDMTTIISDVEPDILLLDPEKLLERHEKIIDLKLCHSSKDFWNILFNSPRGFYMQEWNDVLKKFYYIDNLVVDFLYDKVDLEDLETHPIVSSAACVEMNIDHIRARYLFAARSGYKALSFMFPVQIGLQKPTLKDFLLSDNDSYLKTFAPFCTKEEYNTFASLLKEHKIEKDDIEVYEKLSELNSLKI